MDLTRRRALTGALAAGVAGALNFVVEPTAQAAQPTFRKLYPPQLSVSPSSPSPLSPTYLGSMRMGPDQIPQSYISRNGEWAVHPTQLGNWVNAHLDAYTLDKDRRHLSLVGGALQGVADHAVAYAGALFISYEFAWGTTPKNWNSSFGQSKFPIAYHRMYGFTGDRKWLGHRDKVLAAFDVPRGAHRWIVDVDTRGDLWFEESPLLDGSYSHIFNGHTYAAKEMLDYATRAQDSHVLDMVRGALQTMYDYRNVCRRPGLCSSYDESGNEIHSYHNANTSCFNILYNLTNHAPFAAMVDLMVRDYPTTVGAGVLRISPTRQTIRNGSSTKTWTPTTALSLHSSRRLSFPGVAGPWSVMDSGPFAGWYLKESAYAFRTGVTNEAFSFRFPRRVVFAAGVHRGHTVDANGVVSLAKTATLSRASIAHSTGRAFLNGGHYLLVSDGLFKNLWVPEGLAHYA